MRIALLQMTSSDVPSDNAATIVDAVAQAKEGGAVLLLTPEVSNCLSASRAQQDSVLENEDQDPTLSAVRSAAGTQGIAVNLGSLAIKTDDPDGRFANRSFLISANGNVLATYDKMHMFDVVLSETESYRESKGYRPGETAVTVDLGDVRLGLTICYDLRFPHLFRALAKDGADIITVPSAFAIPTGQAHWEVLLRARAIETGCFIVAAAQTGTHPATRGKSRSTYGHSLVVSPWGDVLLDAGDAPGLHFVDLDLNLVKETRTRVPSLSHDRPFTGP